MKKKIVAGIMITALSLALFGITFEIPMMPVVFSDQSVSRREVWKLLDVTVPGTMDVDIDVTVTPKSGVYIACSPNVTQYFEDEDAQLAYGDWMEWLNRSTADHHWEGMDWYISDGSLTTITYDEIQQWGIMYMDTGNVPYMTFMGNTYMADSKPCNDTHTRNDENPDIISTANWVGNTIKIIDNLPINASIRTKVNVAFKIVLTEPGVYTFDISAPGGVELSETSWVIGGVKTFIVPGDYPMIQDAIDAAASDYTIFVASGTYNERLVIDKQVNLTGSGAATIVRPTSTPAAGVYDVEIDANGTIIQNFLFDFNGVDDTRGGTGIVVGDMNEPPVTNVQILDSIIYTGDGSAETFICGQGIQTGKYCDVSGLLIQRNTFYGDSTGMGEGVYVNPYNGAGDVTIYDNEFYGYLFSGVSVEASNVTVSNNVIHSNATKGVYGVRFIDLSGAQTYSEVTISDNIIQNFTYGVRIGTSTDVGSNLTATIQSNNIIGNDVGIWVRYGAYLTGSVHYNNITDNTNYGINNAAGERSVDAAYNWWGDKTGPYHSTNPTGLGNNVSDNVLFEPWLIKPYPPLAPISVVYVNPQFINLTAPALGTTFSVDVNIANVTSMYAFQLTLEWNNTLLDPTDANPKVPTPWLGLDVWINQTWTAKNYSLAIAPIHSGAATFNGSTTLVSVTFRAIKDPVYPNNVTCSLALKKVVIGDASATSIPHITYSGNYSCYSTMPKLLVMPPNPTARKVPTQFAVNITVTNVVNLQSFEFNFTYNHTLLKAIKVENPPYIPVPYQEPSVGGIYIKVGSISPALNGSMTLVTITFKVMRGFAWSTQATAINCTLGFDPTNHTLNLGAPITHEVVNGTYSYVPLQGDVYFMDGFVDIYDLLFVASKFGTTYGPPYDDPGDLNCDGEIDILDIILVARSFGAEV